jgi:hypothetical protein
LPVEDAGAWPDALGGGESEVFLLGAGTQLLVEVGCRVESESGGDGQ